MLIEKGEKVHIIYRSLYGQSTRRHFVGEVLAYEAGLCRVKGFVFVYDERKTEFVKKPEARETIIKLGDSGFIINMISSNAQIDKVTYKYQQDKGLVATDGLSFSLDINEFGVKS
ncbi:hypothetical protein ACUR5C_00835 [Aliikangiella sp. IMCC44653]